MVFFHSDKEEAYSVRLMELMKSKSFAEAADKVFKFLTNVVEYTRDCVIGLGKSQENNLLAFDCLF